MRDSFNKVKKRAFNRAVILSAAGGVCIGLAITGIFLLSFKLTAVELGWYIYLIIGACSAGLSGTALFFVVRPDDLKIAKMLDEEYTLGERAQTLIEFEGQNGDVLDLQREDAEAAISAIKYKKPAVKRVICAAAAVIICLALFVSGVVVKQKHIVQPTPIDEQPFIITDTQLTLIELLITNVESDGTVDSGLRAEYSEILSDLYDYVTSETATNGGMVVEVQTAMLEISTCTFTVNTYDNFISAFDSIDDGKQFAQAIYDCATVYKSTSNISSYETVTSKAKTLADDITSVMDELIEDITAVTDATEFATDFGTTLQSYMSTLSAAMNYDTVNSSDFPDGDGLYSAIETLYTDFLKYYTSYENSGGYTIDWYHDNITTSLNTFSLKVSNIMYGQTYNCMVDEYARQSLADIFGVAIQGLDNPTVSDTNSGEGDNGSSSQGGAGTGETLYGSDDYIYNPNYNPNDPDSSQYVSYGELLSATTNSYLARLYAMLDSEDITDEVKSYIRTYINKLLGASGE